MIFTDTLDEWWTQAVLTERTALIVAHLRDLADWLPPRAHEVGLMLRNHTGDDGSNPWTDAWRPALTQALASIESGCADSWGEVGHLFLSVRSAVWGWEDFRLGRLGGNPDKGTLARQLLAIGDAWHNAWMFSQPESAMRFLPHRMSRGAQDALVLTWQGQHARACAELMETTVPVPARTSAVQGRRL